MAHRVLNGVAQPVASHPLVTDEVALAQVFDGNDGVAHGVLGSLCLVLHSLCFVSRTW